MKKQNSVIVVLLIILTVTIVLTSCEIDKTYGSENQQNELDNETTELESDDEIANIIKEADENYAEKESELNSVISSVKITTYSRSYASEETIARCAWQQLRDELKDPYSAELSGYSNVEYDPYGRVFCKLVYRAKNSFGAYVKETKYIVLNSCTLSGTYKYSDFFYSSSENTVKYANKWNIDPDADNQEKETAYKNAIINIKTQNYNYAYTLLNSIEDYKESKQILQCLKEIIKADKYRNGVKYFESGNYDKAKSVLSDVSDYMKSNRLIELCRDAINQKQYSVAYDAFTAGEYEKAKELFIKLDNYNDSRQMANECTEMMYKSAVNLVDDGSYADALALLKKLGDYKDTKELIEKCNNAIIVETETDITETELSEAETIDNNTAEITISETEPQETQAPETKAPETDSPETKKPETKAFETKEPETETESVTTSHIHTAACKKWIVDTPYKPAVYENQKVVDIPYSPAEYGDVPYETTDCHYKVEFYSYLESLVFSSSEKFEEWVEKSGAVLEYNYNGGEVYIDGERHLFGYTKYDYYNIVKYNYGIVKPEQPEVSHIEKVLVSPEQQEKGHYEYICGY